MTFDLPQRRNVDALAELVRAVLSRPRTKVLSLTLTSTPPRLVAEVVVPAEGPPDGELPYQEPESVWGVLHQVPVVELELPAAETRVQELQRHLVLALSQARRDSLVGLGWVATPQTAQALERGSYDTLLGLPVVTLTDLPDGKLLLLAGRSAKLGMVRAEQAYVITVPEKVLAFLAGKE